MTGPQPNPNRQRRNTPTIPTTNLPAAGRPGAAPSPPKWITLGDAGRAWWRWAWKTPHAAGWSDGDLVTLAHRAGLEDDLDAVEKVKGLDLLEALGGESDDMTRLIKRLAALATGRVGILREIRELDSRLGLTPKGMSDLRWKIAVDAVEETAMTAPLADDLSDRRRRLGA